MALFFWTGEEEFLIREKQEHWIKAFSEKHGDMNISTLDGQESSPGEIVAEIQSVPFLAEKRLIFIKSLPPSTTDSFDPRRGEVILDGFKGIEESNVVVLIQPKPDKRTSFYKELVKISQVEEFKLLSEKQLESWIQSRIEKKGGKILPAALLYFIELVGVNLWKYENEIDKLLQFTNGEKSISEQDIEKLVVPVISSNVFKFLDAVSEKNSKKALFELHSIMAEGESLMQLFALFIRHIRTFILAKSLKNPTKDDLVKELKLHPFVAQKTLAALRKFEMKELKDLYQKCFDIDLGVKTGKISISTGNEKALALEIEKCLVQLTN